MTQETVHRPVLIKKKVVESDGCIWGYVTESNGKLNRINIRDMLSMYLNGVTFLVDYAGADKPSTLQVIHQMKGNQLVFHFRSIGDQNKKNNLSTIPSIQYGSSKRIKVLKP